MTPRHTRELIKLLDGQRKQLQGYCEFSLTTQERHLIHRVLLCNVQLSRVLKGLDPSV